MTAPTIADGRERLMPVAARPVPGPDRSPPAWPLPPLALAVHALGIAAGSGPAQPLDHVRSPAA